MIAIGDRVQFTAKFLRSTGQYTGRVPFLKGKVTRLETLGGQFKLAVVQWEGDDEQRVNVANLKRVGQPEAD
jgi:hypothetical protein